MSAAHHVEDVGKILLQAQSDLRRIREQLAPPGAQGEAAFVSEQLAQVVEKAEERGRAPSCRSTAASWASAMATPPAASRCICASAMERPPPFLANEIAAASRS